MNAKNSTQICIVASTPENIKRQNWNLTIWFYFPVSCRWRRGGNYKDEIFLMQLFWFYWLSAHRFWAAVRIWFCEVLLAHTAWWGHSKGSTSLARDWLFTHALDFLAASDWVVHFSDAQCLLVLVQDALSWRATKGLRFDSLTKKSLGTYLNRWQPGPGQRVPRKQCRPSWWLLRCYQNDVHCSSVILSWIIGLFIRSRGQMEMTKALAWICWITK